MEKNTYPVEEWKVTEEKFVKDWNYRNETTFALSNGYIGTRGTFDEGYPFTVDEGLEGNFINCLLYTSPSPRDRSLSRMPSSA